MPDPQMPPNTELGSASELGESEKRKHPVYRRAIEQLRKRVLENGDSAADVADALLQDAESGDEATQAAALQFSEDVATHFKVANVSVTIGKKQSKDLKQLTADGEDELPAKARALKSNSAIGDDFGAVLRGDAKPDLVLNAVAERRAMRQCAERVTDPAIQIEINDALDQLDIEPVVAEVRAEVPAPAVPAEEPAPAESSDPDAATIESIHRTDQFKEAFKTVVRQVLYGKDISLSDALEAVSSGKSKFDPDLPRQIARVIGHDLKKIGFNKLVEEARAHGADKLERWKTKTVEANKAQIQSVADQVGGTDTLLAWITGKKKASPKQLASSLGISIAVRGLIAHYRTKGDAGNADLLHSLVRDQLSGEEEVQIATQRPTQSARASTVVQSPAAIDLPSLELAKNFTISEIEASPEYHELLRRVFSTVFAETESRSDRAQEFATQLETEGRIELANPKNKRRQIRNAAAAHLAKKLRDGDEALDQTANDAFLFEADARAEELVGISEKNLGEFKLRLKREYRTDYNNIDEPVTWNMMQKLHREVVVRIFSTLRALGEAGRRRLRAAQDAVGVTDEPDANANVSPNIEAAPVSAAAIAEFLEATKQKPLVGKPSDGTTVVIERIDAPPDPVGDAIRRADADKLREARDEQRRQREATLQAQRDTEKSSTKSAEARKLEQLLPPIRATARDIPRVGGMMTLDVFLDSSGAPHAADRTLFKIVTESRSGVVASVSMQEASKRFVFDFGDQQPRLLPNIASKKPYPLLVSVTDRSTDPTDPSIERVRVEFPQSEQFVPKDLIRPIEYDPETQTYILPDQGRVKFSKLDAQSPGLIDLPSGFLVASVEGDAPNYPFLEVRSINKKVQAPLPNCEYIGRVLSADEVRYRRSLETALQKYHQDVTFATWKPSGETDDDLYAVPQPALQAHRLNYPWAIREKMIAEIREGSKNTPLEVVVSSAARTIRVQGFDQLRPLLQDLKNKNAQSDTQTLVAELTKLLASATQTLEAFEQQGKDPKKAALVARPDFWKKYETFFERIQEPNVRDLFGFDIRKKFFPSDLDGESAIKMFELAGIETRVFVFTPDAGRKKNNAPAVYRPHAVHLDITHGAGKLYYERQLEIVNGTPDDIGWVPTVVFLDEDEKRIFSSTEATRQHLVEMGLLDTSHRRMESTLAQLVSEIDGFVGLFEDKEIVAALVANMDRNIYGLQKRFVDEGRFETIFACLREAFQDIHSRVVRDRPELVRPDQERTLRNIILKRLVRYDLRQLIKKIEPELAAESQRIFDEQADMLNDKVDRLHELERAGFVGQTRFGKTVFDPASALRPVNGLFAFGRGYDCYIGYTRAHGSAVINVAPFASARIGESDFVDAEGKPIGNIIKGGRYLVTNASTNKFRNFEHVVMGSLGTDATVEQAPSGVQQYMAAESGQKKEIDAFVDSVHPGLRTGARAQQVATQPPTPFVEPVRAQEPTAVTLSERREAAVPHPPDVARLQAAAIADKPPESSRRPQNLEQLMHTALRIATPETLYAELAHSIIDLSRGRASITAARAGLTESEKKLVWEPTIRQWWNGLSDAEHGKFIAAAKRFETPDEKDAAHRAARVVGYQRLLTNMCARDPEREYQLYAAAIAKHEIICPEGFGAAASADWKIFVARDWVNGLSVQQRKRLEDGIAVRRNIPARRAELRAQQVQKQAELDKYKGFSGVFRRVIDNPVRINRAGAEYAHEKLAREISEIGVRLHELEVIETTVRELSLFDARLHSAGEASGVGSAALDAAEKVTVTDKKGEMPRALNGRILAALNGQQEAIPAVVNQWLLAGASARAASAVQRGGSIETPTQFSGDYSRDDEAHLFALQTKITTELAELAERGTPLKQGIEKEPLKSLLRSYRDSASTLPAETREHHAQFQAHFEQLIAETDTELRRRGVKPKTARFLVPTKDQSWIAALLAETPPRAAADQLTRPDATVFSLDKHVTDIRLRETSIVDGKFNLTRRLIDALLKFEPAKDKAVAMREAREFLHHGWVFERGDRQQKTFYKDGNEAVLLHVGDAYTVVQDVEAPFGIHIEIDRAPASERQGIVDSDADGTQLYYDKQRDGTVHVWAQGARDEIKYRGYFEGRKFVERSEKMFDYRSADGKQKQVGEFDSNVFFAADGTVFSKQKRGGGVMTKLGQLTKPFERTVTVQQRGGSSVKIDLADTKRKLFVTPKNKVVEFHASVNEMRELGEIQR